MEPYIVLGITVAMTIIGTLIMGWKKSVDEQQARQDNELAEIKTNYIQRFDSIKEKINDTEKNILLEISKIQVTLATNTKNDRESRRKGKL